MRFHSSIRCRFRCQSSKLANDCIVILSLSGFTTLLSRQADLRCPSCRAPFVWAYGGLGVPPEFNTNPQRRHLERHNGTDGPVLLKCSSLSALKEIEERRGSALPSIHDEIAPDEAVPQNLSDRSREEGEPAEESDPSELSSSPVFNGETGEETLQDSFRSDHERAGSVAEERAEEVFISPETSRFAELCIVRLIVVELCEHGLQNSVFLQSVTCILWTLIAAASF